ncbi:MAG: hypothetical protein RLZZ227_1666 [Pseudomonadota bacterium]|jgi:hypothetical protein
MKCYYYLSPTLAETQRVSDDLHQSGVDDWFVHIISKNEAGLQRQRLHSGNYLETMDFLREGLLGAACGLVIGLIGAGLLAYFEPFGPDLPVIAYVAVVAVLTLHGAWQGGLLGISSENKKLSHFHDEIEAGKYLILVYAHRNEEEKIHSMMTRLHPEAHFVGIDPAFYNPFREPKHVA